jgi:hypothetical protein
MRRHITVFFEEIRLFTGFDSNVEGLGEIGAEVYSICTLICLPRPLESGNCVADAEV